MSQSQSSTEQPVTPAQILSQIAAITEKQLVQFADIALIVEPVDAMSARILQFTVEQFPTATVGQVAVALTNSLFWQRLLYSMSDVNVGGAT